MHHDCPVCFEVGDYNFIAIFHGFIHFMVIDQFLDLVSGQLHLQCKWLFAVSIRVNKQCDCHAMWTHYSRELLKGDEGTLSVSSPVVIYISL